QPDRVAVLPARGLDEQCQAGGASDAGNNRARCFPCSHLRRHGNHFVVREHQEVSPGAASGRIVVQRDPAAQFDEPTVDVEDKPRRRLSTQRVRIRPTAYEYIRSFVAKRSGTSKGAVAHVDLRGRQEGIQVKGRHVRGTAPAWAYRPRKSGYFERP